MFSTYLKPREKRHLRGRQRVARQQYDDPGLGVNSHRPLEGTDRKVHKRLVPSRALVFLAGVGPVQ